MYVIGLLVYVLTETVHPFCHWAVVTVVKLINSKTQPVICLVI